MQFHVCYLLQPPDFGFSVTSASAGFVESGFVTAPDFSFPQPPPAEPGFEPAEPGLEPAEPGFEPVEPGLSLGGTGEFVAAPFSLPQPDYQKKS